MHESTKRKNITDTRTSIECMLLNLDQVHHSEQEAQLVGRVGHLPTMQVALDLISQCSRIKNEKEKEKEKEMLQ